MIELYGAPDVRMRGPTIAFNFLDPEGRIVDERIVERWAGQERISLRTGCFCNPGAGETAFGVPGDRLASSLDAALPSYDEWLRHIGMQSGGAIRVSLGLVSDFDDVRRFLAFAHRFRDARPDATGLAPRHHC
jgi:selenocysteine lyase/cysteine desulfurase